MEHWYALYTKPKKERQVQHALDDRGIETFLPEIRRRSKEGKKKRVFFPCYLFARVDFEKVSFSSVNWTPGLRRVISFGGKPTVVRQEVVDTIRTRLAQIEAVGYDSCYGFKPGQRVSIKSGPLKDLEAVFDRRLSSSDRVRILVEILGRQTACEVEGSDLGRVA